ncbi:MAG TPA: ACP phosphodiesterase [Azospira sp.]|nr:ACP phosphodiesterase [Azospira sp.]
MNFLAHAYLGGASQDLRLGGFIGDFVKGPLRAEDHGLPAAVLAGVELHRRIDSFAETHPAFMASKARISPERRRVAGIVVDLFYDHFLARNWAELGAGAGLPPLLEDFSAGLYAQAAALEEGLPARLAGLLPRMRDEDWLASYREAETIAFALDRMSQRFTRPSARQALCGAGAELLRDYAGFEADCRAFLPAAQAFVRSWQVQSFPESRCSGD